MEIGQAATVWLARLGAAAYVVAILLMLWRSSGARVVWTAGLLVYLVHVCFAFEYFYEWSHTVALRETARQTFDLFGVNWGGGLYLNYLFTGVWLVDCLWWWRSPRTYMTRPRAISVAIHAFVAFMFVNASLVVWILRARQ